MKESKTSQVLEIREVSRRLELHEAWSSVEHARVQAQLYPKTGAISQPIAGGVAVFAGVKSPLSQVYALGLAGPVFPADLDAVETFYRDRALPARLQVCPFADPSLLRLLGERGYAVQSLMNVHVRQVKTLEDEPPAVPGVSIRVATVDEARLWFELDGSGGDWAEPDGVAFMTIRCTLKADTRLFLAWLDGQPVGGGALEMHEGVAALIAAKTLPAFRHRGLHTALLHARLAAAFQAGNDLALVHTQPGAESQRNVLRAGFQLAYTNVDMRKDVTGSGTL